MKKKQKIGILIFILMLLFQWDYAKPVFAEEKKEVLINQINTVDSDTLTYTATTGGRLEIIVPLAYASQNGNWSVSLEGNQYYKTGKYSSYDVMEDKAVLVAYVPAGTYELDFSGKAVCQINFIVDSINDEIENNDSFDTANQLYLNLNKNGICEGQDYFKIEVMKPGLLSFQVKGTPLLSYSKASITVYKKELDGNLSKVLSDSSRYSDSSFTLSTRRISVTEGTYYIKLDYSGYKYSYVLHNTFVEANTGNYEIEDNNVPISATDIMLNTEINGNLESKEDIDWYHIKNATSQLLQVVLGTERETKKAVYDVTLYKLENNEYKEVDNFVSITNNVAHYGEQIYAEEGDYYIKIKKGKASIDNITLSNKDYTIKVNTKTISFSKPTITLEKSNVDTITVTTNAFETFTTGMELYEKVGDGQWWLQGTYQNNKFQVQIGALGVQCSYKVRPYYFNKETGKTVYGEFSDIQSITLDALKIPTIGITRTDFNKLTLSLKNIDKKANKIEIYEKVGNGTWKLKKTLTKSAQEYGIALKNVGKTYSYKIRIRYKSSWGGYCYSEFSKINAFTLPKQLPKPSFKVEKLIYRSSLAFDVIVKKADYAQYVEIAIKSGNQSWEYGDILNLKKYDTLTWYSLVKGTRYSIKMRSYRIVDGKKVYSPWTDTKLVVR
ncbi:MAG: hypothetical protein IAC13_10345 [Firmicutes bacterium]|uniref:Peptidase C-terminal archaeal/bacterial domain-containing protein n=1 Tax=Candidatus Scybalomonas excrementavium TaxID=2840943 RepID=A0A9D9I1V4_9FIRM|nr:hypothetical protein [Candidatus Scybalomonas excrementavium]